VSEDYQDKANTIAENAFLKLTSRLLLVLAMPFASFFAVNSYQSLQVLTANQVEIKTIIARGLEPRLSFLESEMLQVREDVRNRTATRFDKADAKELRERIERRIDKMENDLGNIRDILPKR